jgi:hypothetical protein
MNFTAAANWICQNPGQDAIIVALAAAAVVLGRRAYKAHRASYRASEEIVDRVMSRPDTSLKLPPHAPRR